MTARAQRIGLVALLLAASAVMSRLLGLIRESVFAALVGAGSEADAYRAAFLIPDVLNHLLAGGALSVAFIPLYTRRLGEGGAEAANRLFAVVLGTLACAVGIATALLWWWVEPLVVLAYGKGGGFAPEVLARVAYLTRILLPAQIFFIVGGVIRGVLMAHDRFWSQAAAPVVYNLGIIAGGALGHALSDDAGAGGFAWGALAGAALGPFGTALVELGTTRVAKLGARVAFRDVDFAAYLWLALPLMLGLGMLTVDEWYDKVFGARLGPSAVAYLGYARQLMLTPVGVIGQSIAIALLPTLSSLWARRRVADGNAVLLGTLQAGLGLALLACAACFVLAVPLVEIVFERGRFTPADTAAVAGLVRVFAFAIPGWVVSQIVPRAFYAREQMWLPMIVGTGVAALMFPLYWALGGSLGVEGLALAGALGMTVSAGALVGVVRAQHGGPDLRPLLQSLLRSGAIAAAVAAAGLVIPTAGGSGLLGALLELGIRGAAMGAVALLGVRALGDAPTRRALDRLLARIPGRGRR